MTGEEMPSKRPAPAIGTSKDGGVIFQYCPSETGIHEMNVSYNDKPTEGTPFRCHVDNSTGKLVTAYGEGLNFAESGKETTFSVCGADCNVSINGPCKTDVNKKSSSGSTTTYSYVPLSPGEYMISIKTKGKDIYGSPFSAKVSAGGEGRKRSQLSITATSEVNIGAKDIDLANATALLKTPSGNSEPCLLKKMEDGSIGIASFTPKSKGAYKVEISEDGKSVKNSPFSVNVGDGQVCTAQKVKVTGAIKEAKANQSNTITIDPSGAGYGNLGVSIEGPHRSDIESKRNNGSFNINYRPHEPGLYLCTIKYGDDHVTGSPFMLSVGGEASGRIRETVTKTIQDCAPAGPGSKCEFQLKIPGTDPLDMEASLTSPNGKTELCDIMDLEHDLYDIKFKPVMDGVHTVSLKHKGLHIAGSPFQYTVGTLPKSGPHKVEIGGPGLEKGEVSAKNEFNIYTRESGGGELSISVEGPSKAKLDVVDRGHGYTTVSYSVSKDGDYGIHVKYDGEHVPDSPASVYISPESADAKMCTVSGIRDRGLELGKPITFNVNKNGAKGEIHAYCDMPGGTEETVFIQELDSQLYALRIMPKENGIHYVHVKLAEAHIPGSPFPMLVGKLGSDPALVMAHGDGLSKAESGKMAKFTVVTTDSGTGPLNVLIEGPSKVAIMCKEVDIGYEFSYTAMAPGDYLITIKYCNITIAGCPTKAVITGNGKPSDIIEQSSLLVETVEKKPGAVTKKRFKGDAGKVVAKGNGLKKAFQNRPANFTLDCKDAGQGLLLVGILSPTGNPLEEISTKRTRPTSYQVTYKTKEKGEHILTVRWGTDDIPGSPFTITV